MFAFVLAALVSLDWLPLPDPPALLARVGSSAFRHPWESILLDTSPDGKQLYTAAFSSCGVRSDLGGVFVWDAENGKLQNSYQLTKRYEHVAYYRFTGDGLRLLISSVSDDCRFCLLEPESGKVIREGKPWSPPHSRGTPGQLSFVSQLPADNWLVYRGDKETVLLNVETGKVTAFTPAVPPEKGSIMVAPDGRTAIVDAADGTIRLWELADMKLLAKWPTTEDREFHGFTPDSKHLVVWENRKAGWALELWSVVGEGRRTVLVQQRAAEEVRFSPNGKAFVLVPGEDLLDSLGWQIRDTIDGKLLMVLRSIRVSPHFSHDGATVWMPRGHTFVPYDLTTKKARANGPEPAGSIQRFRFVGEDKLMGFCDNHVITWNAMSGKELARVDAPKTIDSASGIAFSPSAERLLFTDADGDLVSWDSLTKAGRKTVVNPTGRKRKDLDHQLSADGQLHIAREKNILILRDPADGKILIERPCPETWAPRKSVWDLATLAVSKDRKVLAASRYIFSGVGPIALVDLTNPKAAASVLEPGYNVSSMAIDPKSQVLIAIGEKEDKDRIGSRWVLSVWDLTTKKQTRTVTIPASQSLSSQFAPDGKLLAVHCGDHVLVLDTQTWAIRARFWAGPHDSLTRLPNEERGDTLAWSPSGRLLAVETDDERLAVWDVSKLVGEK